MRLHFWALRESGCAVRSPSFFAYYIKFIAHFVSVYETTAPYFARSAARWSAEQTNLDAYEANDHRMEEALYDCRERASFPRARATLPAAEQAGNVGSAPHGWPYSG